MDKGSRKAKKKSEGIEKKQAQVEMTLRQTVL
jgi:hypothetical protein